MQSAFKITSKVARLFKIITAVFTIFTFTQSSAFASDKMTPEQLLETIKSYADEVESKGNLISFMYKGITVYCIFDKKADRMRLVSPIVEVEKVPQEALIIALQANYHTVLDARYAIGDGIVYAAFIHPLSPLNSDELQSAIRQVSTAALTFGDQYTSGELSFPGQSAEEKSE